MFRKVLVAYAGKTDRMAGIAETIGTELRAAGYDVDVRTVSEVGSISEYDVVILGSAVHTGRWRHEAVRFLRRHVEDLRERQVWLFHSGPAGADTDEEQTMPRKVARLAEKIGVKPAKTFAEPMRPETASGRPDHRPAHGDLTAESSDRNEIAAWARDVGTSISYTDLSDWHPSHRERSARSGRR